MSLCVLFSFLFFFFFFSPFKILEIISRFLVPIKAVLCCCCYKLSQIDHLCCHYHLQFFEDCEASDGPNKEINEGWNKGVGEEVETNPPMGRNGG